MESTGPASSTVRNDGKTSGLSSHVSRKILRPLARRRKVVAPYVIHRHCVRRCWSLGPAHLLPSTDSFCTFRFARKDLCWYPLCWNAIAGRLTRMPGRGSDLGRVHIALAPEHHHRHLGRRLLRPGCVRTIRMKGQDDAQSARPPALRQLQLSDPVFRVPGRWHALARC